MMTKEFMFYKDPTLGMKVTIWGDPLNEADRLDEGTLVNKICDCPCAAEGFHFELWDIIPTETSLQSALIKVKDKEKDNA